MNDEDMTNYVQGVTMFEDGRFTKHNSDIMDLQTVHKTWDKMK